MLDYQCTCQPVQHTLSHSATAMVGTGMAHTTLGCRRIASSAAPVILSPAARESHPRGLIVSAVAACSGIAECNAPCQRRAFRLTRSQQRPRLRGQWQDTGREIPNGHTVAVGSGSNDGLRPQAPRSSTISRNGATNCFAITQRSQRSRAVTPSTRIVSTLFQRGVKRRLRHNSGIANGPIAKKRSDKMTQGLSQHPGCATAGEGTTLASTAAAAPPSSDSRVTAPQCRQ
jgi:hypothetical protein